MRQPYHSNGYIIWQYQRKTLRLKLFIINMATFWPSADRADNVNRTREQYLGADMREVEFDLLEIVGRICSQMGTSGVLLTQDADQRS